MADDDLPDAPWASNDDNDLPDAPWASSSPDDSSELGAFARGAAHGAIPAAGGVLAGVATGAGLGALGAGPVGAAVGGLAGGIVGGAALEKGEDWLLDKMGWRDKAQEQADQEQHPNWRMAGEMAPAALSLHPSGSLAQRAVGAAIGGGAGAATDLIENGEIDPTNVLAGAGMGAAFPSVNRLGAAAERLGARAGAAIRPRAAPVTAAETPPEPPSRDLKLTPDIYTEADPPLDPAKATEWGQAQSLLASLDPRDPMRAHIQSRLDELGKATKQTDGQATPSTPPTVSLGVAETRPAPTQDPTIAGNQTGAPMDARVAARTSDPVRDYRKTNPDEEDMRGGSAWGATDQDIESTSLNTDAMHPDIAAALNPTERQSTFQQKTVQQPAQAPQPEGPVETGLPQTPSQAAPQPQAPVTRAGQRITPQQLQGLVQRATQRAVRRPIVETPMPSGANSSKNINGPVYVDPSVPVELRRPVAVHETVEQALMAEGMPYEQAHEHATAAEEAAVRAAGMDVNKYNEQWDGILKHVEHKPYDPSTAPQDMHVDPEQAIGHYAGRNGDQPIETGITAAVTPKAVTPDTVRAKLNALGFKKALAAFDAMSPADQAADASKFAALTENMRAPRKTETGVGFRDKADQARKEGSTKAVQQAVDEANRAGSNRPDLTLERNPENKAAIIEHATDLYERAKELYDGKDPVKYVEGDKTSGYKPTNPSPAHNLVIAARRIALAKKPTWAALGDYVQAVALKGETGKNVDAGIAMSRRPSVEDVEGSITDTSSTRPTHQDFDNSDEGESKVYVDQQNELRSWLNGLSDDEHAKIMKANPDLETDLQTTQDPEELKRNYMDDLAAVSGKRPGKIELVPGEDAGGGKRTPIKTAEDLEDAEAKPKSKWDEITEAADKFLADNGGGGPLPTMPQFVKDFFTPSPYDPDSPHRDAQITSFLDMAPKWFRQHANARSADKGWIASNGRAAAAHDLTQDELKQVRDAYDHKTERSLPGKLYDFAKQTYEPLLAKVDSTYQDIVDLNKKHSLGLDLEDPHAGFDTRHTPHQRIGEDISDKENVNVVSGNAMSLWSPATQARNFKTLYDSASGRKIVLHEGDDGKFSLVQNGNVRPLTKLPSSFEGKVGDTLELASGGKKTVFTVDHAAADEVEAATAAAKKPEDRVTYETNPIEVASNRLNQLQAIKQNIETLQKFKDEPLWTDKLTTDNKDVARQRGWDIIPSKHPDFDSRNGKDLYMPRNVRWMIDDAFRQGFGGDDANWFRRAGSGLARVFMTFGSPIHVANIATNAIIGRGFDNITPQGIRSLGSTAVRAFKAVNDAANNKDYLDFLKAGGRPQFLNTQTNDLIPTIRQRMGGDMGKDPSKWDPIAKIWGVSTPDLARAVENFSTKEMWRAGDMFTLQKFLENRDFKGMSPEDAAADTHKFLPAYDLPSTVGGRGQISRFVSQALADPAVSLFGRYHMDLLRSFSHVTRSIVAPSSTSAERLKGVGQAMTMAALAYVAYPGLDKLLQGVSGNPDAEMGRRGMVAVTDALGKMVKGDSDYTRLTSNLFTPSIPLNTIMKGFANTTWNRKQIVQQMPLNSGRNVAKAAGQAGDWVAGTTIAPYGNVASGLTKPGSTVAGTAGRFAAGMVGGHLPSDAERNYKAHEQQITNRETKAREKRPAGPLEWVANQFGR